MIWVNRKIIQGHPMLTLVFEATIMMDLKTTVSIGWPGTCPILLVFKSGFLLSFCCFSQDWDIWRTSIGVVSKILTNRGIKTHLASLISAIPIFPYFFSLAHIIYIHYCMIFFIFSMPFFGVFLRTSLFNFICCVLYIFLFYYSWCWEDIKRIFLT